MDRPIANRLTPRDLAWPDLPRALDGVRVAHLTDLHIRKPRPWHEALIETLDGLAPDLVALTGDIMDRRAGHEAAVGFVRRLVGRVSPRLGLVGCFGNHDLRPVRESLGEIEGLVMLANEGWAAEDAPLYIGGIDVVPDGAPGDIGRAMAGAGGGALGEARVFRMLLAHVPIRADQAAEAGVDLMLSGHTHGGQVRLPGGRAIATGCHWPRRDTAGLFARGVTRLAISRGLGETRFEGLRLNCPRQLPLYTLRRGPSPHAGLGVYEGSDRDQPEIGRDGLRVIERW